MTHADEAELHEDSVPSLPTPAVRLARVSFVAGLLFLSVLRATPITRVGNSAAARLAPAYDLTASEQRWSMFSNPSNMSRSVRATVRLEDGRVLVWEVPDEPRWQVLRFRRMEKLTTELQDPDNFDVWPSLAAAVSAEAGDDDEVVEVVLERVLVNPPNLGEDGGTTVRVEPFFSSVAGLLPWDAEAYAE